ncbi:myo-inositol-1(or 4)-monophosphatase [Herbihabitans rhizosphaerae]|uniref:Inositol-1-monophosphatase n=1 Tax=Herbihabitans rhizosphaerae TaxID=1872711 RepID=A0A4V2ERY3_9PSEU|nr:inositol monophosphatase family protein [Herbihabitans rhizosphaerae]RZS34467.1 myo-inositol-1(or 4)-monophosphatase [Herbihabitans rhizosphaerae]
MGAQELDLLRVAVTVAREASSLVESSRSSAITDVDTKSSETDVVTAADKAAERLVRDRLAELRPGEPVLGEEEGESSAGAPAGGVCWVVDPIDGTVNYLYGYPWYAVSVAAQVDGVSVAGAVVEPASGRVWTAARGEGAWLDDRPLRVSGADRLDLSLVSTGFAYRPERRRRQAAAIAGLLGRVRDIRRAGAASLDLCAVAAGWVDAYAEHGLSRWDWAAGALVAEEAGAIVRVPGDGSDGLGAEAIIASAPGVADEFHTALREVGFGVV